MWYSSLMKASLGHIQVNINPKNLSFYKELMALLGCKSIMEADGMAGFEGENKASVWFLPRQKEVDNDYDGVGMNHLGFNVDSMKEVDEVVLFLKDKGFSSLFDTPRHRPDFAGENGVYYQ